jgi:hypothetical protein
MGYDNRSASPICQIAAPGACMLAPNIPWRVEIAKAREAIAIVLSPPAD